MLYCLNKEQLENLSKTYFLADFKNAEMVVATFVTDINIAKKIVPHPLSVTHDSLATAFVARYPDTNFGCVYNEGALFIHCKYKGENGLYCLSMPVDDDMAMVGGREQFGYPKKMADNITLNQDNNTVVGSVIRKGVEILRIECQLGEEVGENFLNYLGDPTLDWDGVPCTRVLSFLFKYFQNPGGGGFDYLPRLIREPILFRTDGKILGGEGKVKLSSTPYDPLGEVPVGEIVKVFFGKWHNTMLPGRVVAKIWNPIKFAKHAFFKIDAAATLISSFDPNRSDRAKEIFRAAKKY